jgi:hypothetical protein
MILLGSEILTFPGGFPSGVNDKCEEDAQRATLENT